MHSPLHRADFVLDASVYAQPPFIETIGRGFSLGLSNHRVIRFFLTIDSFT